MGWLSDGVQKISGAVQRAGSAIGTGGASEFIGGTGGKILGGNFSGAWDDIGGGGDRKKAQEAQQRFDTLSGNQYRDLQGQNQKMDEADKAYQGAYGNAWNGYKAATEQPYKEYLGTAKQLQSEVEAQAKDARQVYSGTIQPAFKNVMENAARDAKGAMSLAEASDPNNRVQTAVRGMFEQQAQGVGKVGLSNAGVLQSLGTQATAQQFGSGGPMSTAQLQALQAVNQTQAGQAFARAQGQMERLRQQGIVQGFAESDKAYDRGQAAVDRLQNTESQFAGRLANLRGEREGMASNVMGTQMGRAGQIMQGDLYGSGLSHQFAQDKNLRDTGAMNQYYGNKMGTEAGKVQQANAAAAGKMGVLSSLIGAGGAVAGGMMGGPKGAQVGQQAGSQVGQGVAGAMYQPQAVPQPYGVGQAGQVYPVGATYFGPAQYGPGY